MESLKFNLAVGDVVPSTSKSVKKENSRKVAVGDVIPSNSNNAKKENSRKKDQINVTKVRLNVNPQAVGLLNGSRTLIFRELTKNVSPFYILNLNRALFMNVSIKEFKELNGLVIVNKYKKITCIGGSKNECLSVIKKYDLWAESLYPEILQTLKDIFEGGKIMINTAQLLGGASRLIKGNQNLIKDFALNITSLFLKIINFSELGVSVAGILDMSLELYRTFCLCEPLIKSELQPEFLLSGIAAAASLVLPKTLFEIFKRMSVFSNAKFLDDVSGLFSLYCTVVEYITTLIDYLPFRCPQMVVDLLNRVSNFAGYGLLYRSKALVNKWRTNRRSMLELDFRNSVTSLNAEIVASEYLTEWARRSPAVNDYLKEFKCLKKATISYESSVRIEPCCFVFEGGPGTSKSITMNNLIQVLGESAYSHIVKPTTDGKDFYDSYNDEEIMFLDDVGQQGISQWRFLINFVSPVKLPLDCANADLKDTKFLTSSKIFITTNRFSTLQGLCKNDGIDCLGALHRRAYVFNYDYVKRVNGVMTGTVQFKYFDLTKGWTHDFPQDFKDYCLMNNLSIPASFNITHRNLHYLAWLAQIVKIFQAVKLQQESDNTLTPEDIQDVKALQSAFELTPESLLECADFAAFYCGVVVGELANIVTNSIDKFVEVYNFLNDSTTLVSKLLITCIASLLFVMASNYMKQKSIISSEMLEVIKGANESPDLMRHPMIESIQRQIFDIQFTDFKQVTTKAVAVFTGRYFITVSHISVMSEGYLVVYKNYAANHRIIDGMKVKLLWRSLDNDCSVWELPNSYPTPFRDISTIYQPSTISYKSYLITPLALCNIENIKPTCPQLPMSYRINADSYTIDQDDIVYKIHYAGMCGSVSVSESGKMLGIHVAGSISGNDLGCSKRFTEADLFEIHSIVSQRAPISLKAKMSQKVIPNFSGMKLDENCNIHSSTKSNIIQSPLYGTFPISRYPAVLDVYGRHTIKDISKKGFNPITTVAHEEILFAQQVIGNIIAPFEDITMYEVIKGTPFLSGLKRDSSNGFNCPKLKTDCVDFEKGELTPSFQLTYDDFLAKIDKGEVEVSDIAWKASLKDELRDPGKDPRAFRVSRLCTTLLAKSIFGNMVAQVMQERDHNGIMIGVNPFKEWGKIYQKLDPYKFWTGDFKGFDGNMLQQAETAACEELRKRYRGNLRRFDFAIAELLYSVVAVNDDVYMSTHGMSSGHFLTALLNSLINKMYKAMWYYRYTKVIKTPSVNKYFHDVIDLVYGDDTIMAVKTPSLEGVLNAVTMTAFCQSIGLDFTDSNKKPFEKPFQNWEEVTFLKRSFTVHPILNEIVGPLAISTIYSSISWIDKKKDSDIVMRDKINVCQRELFLHYELYERDINHLALVCDRKGILFEKLPERVLVDLYKTGDYEYREDLYGIKQNID